jgi:hypothetical protein
MVFPGSPHIGTIINLGLIFLAAILALYTQANGKFKKGAIILNWFEVSVWTLSLIPALIKISQSEKMSSHIGFAIAMTLALIIPCIVNGILIIWLPSRLQLEKLSSESDI